MNDFAPLINRVCCLTCLVLITQMTGCKTNDIAKQDRQADITPLRVEVEAICAQMEEAMRDNDLEKVASFYTDDGILLSPSGNTRGGSREALEEYWRGFGQGVDWSLTTRSVEGRDKLVIQRGQSILTYIKNEDQHISTVEFILLWQRQEDGTLKIAVDGYW